MYFMRGDKVIVLQMFLPRALVWLDLTWPFVHIRKGRRVK